MSDEPLPFERENLPERLPRYRNWLRVLAEMELGARLQGKFDASDIAQQALLEAVRDLPAFRGQSEAELAAWLRTILAHVLAHQFRQYRGTGWRDIDREVSLENVLGSLEQSSLRLDGLLADTGPSPSEQAVRRERSARLADVLGRLPDEYREVILLRNVAGLPHEEVARRMSRSSGAVRMLWLRALARLREEIGAVNSESGSRP